MVGLAGVLVDGLGEKMEWIKYTVLNGAEEMNNHYQETRTKKVDLEDA